MRNKVDKVLKVESEIGSRLKIRQSARPSEVVLIPLPLEKSVLLIHFGPRITHITSGAVERRRPPQAQPV